MEHKLLDAPDPIQRNPLRFSQLSFINAIVSMSLFVMIILRSAITIYPPLSIVFSPPLWLGIIFPLAAISGLVFTILSFTKREPKNKRKYFGTTINIAMFLVLIFFASKALTIYFRHFATD